MISFDQFWSVLVSFGQFWSVLVNLQIRYNLFTINYSPVSLGAGDAQRRGAPGGEARAEEGRAPCAAAGPAGGDPVGVPAGRVRGRGGREAMFFLTFRLTFLLTSA